MASAIFHQLEALEARQLLSISPAAILPDHAVRIAYLIPSNRTAQTDAVATLRTAVKWYQDWFAEQMDRNGFGRKTFALETLADGVTPDVHVLPLPQTDAYYRADSWGRIQADAGAGGINIWGPGESWLLFFEGHVQTPDGRIDGGSAGGTGPGSGGGGGVAVLGSDMIELIKSSYLTDNRPYAGLTLPVLGPYPLAADAFIVDEGTTLSSVASSRIGAVAHELTHTFGVAHGFRNDENFHGNLLGNGLRGFRGNLLPDLFPDDWTRLEFADALALSTNRFFNAGGSFTDNVLPIIGPVGGSVMQGSLELTFSVMDAGGLSAVLLGNDSGIIDQKRLSGTGATTSFIIPDYQPQQNNHYYLFVYDQQGNRTDYDFPMGVGAVADRAPTPFVKIVRETVAAGQPLTLDASASSDPEGAALSYEWDLNGDGVFDTGALTTPVYSTSFASAGTRLIQLRVTDPSGGSSLSAPIGIRVTGQAPPGGSITGVVFNDADADGTRDAGEAGVGGVTLYLDTNKNSAQDASEPSTLSDASGNYAFTGLSGGTYRVRSAGKTGWRITTAGYVDRTIASGQSAALHFGLTQKVLITGKLFNDSDGDGVKDTSEAPLTGWRVYVDLDKDGVWDSATEPSLLTDTSGNYTFKNLAAGTCRVREVLPRGWRIVRPSAGCRDITLAAGASSTGQDFATTQKVLITGSLFNDVNSNGKRDAGEGALAGWTLYIDSNKNFAYDPASERAVTTDAAGAYAFQDLPAGSYRVRNVLKSGWRRVNPAWGYYDLNPASGAIVSAKDFALTQKVLICGSVFNDANASGIKEAGESPLSAWRVYIDANRDGKWQSSEKSVLSDASGKWLFSDLAGNATYYIRVVQQAGWKLITPRTPFHAVTLSAGGSSTGKVFGERKIA